MSLTLEAAAPLNPHPQTTPPFPFAALSVVTQVINASGNEECEVGTP